MIIAALIAVGAGIDLIWRSIHERRKNSMTPADVGLWTTLGATLVCAFYAALGYHRPKAATSAALPQTHAAPSESHIADPVRSEPKPSRVPIIAMLVAIAAASFTIIDRHWFIPQTPDRG